MKPLLKWAGGKRQLSNMLDNHARRHSDNPQFEIAN
jgi:site-specific DNA-adenine methylase